MNAEQSTRPRETAIDAAYDALALLESAEAQARNLNAPAMLPRVLRVISEKVAIALAELEDTAQAGKAA